MLAMELNETQHAGWTFRRYPDEFTIVRVLRYDDRVKIVVTANGEVRTHTAGMVDDLDIQPPAKLTLPAGVADEMPAAPTAPALLAGLDMGEQNLIISGLEKLWYQCISEASKYGVEETAKYLAAPADVRALIVKLQANARAQHAA